jgi:hypothetical protein
VNVKSDQAGMEIAHRAYPTLKLATEDVIEWLDGPSN